MKRHPFRVLKRLAGFCLFCVAAVLDFVWSVRRFERGIDFGLRAQWSQKWGRVLLKVLGVRVFTLGTPPIKGVLACNHLGYLDIPVLASIGPTIFVSKSEVRHWPVLGWLARSAGTLFIDRARKSGVKGLSDDFAAVQDHGVLLTLFPEGTSSDGRTVLHFHSSLLQAPVVHGWPVAGAWIGYSLGDGVVQDEVCYWGDMTFLPHFLNLLSKETIEATVVFGEPVQDGMTRKEMAVALHTQVSELGPRASFHLNNNGES